MNIYSTDTLMRVVENMYPAPQFIVDRYFPTIQTEMSEEIHFDLYEDMRRVAPFVNPLVEGQIVESLGYITTTFKPPYIKDKRVFDTFRPFRRQFGENFTGTLTPANRTRAMLAQDLQDQMNMVARREEVMAAETLITGKLVIEGDKYKRVQLDFKRNSGLIITANPAWDQPAAKPINDLTTASDAMLATVGTTPTDVIMGVKAWAAFRQNTQVQDWLNLNRNLASMPSITNTSLTGEGGTFMGTVDRWNIFVYAGWWIDPMTGTKLPIWDEKAVVMVSPKLDGVRCYGAIKDYRAIGGEVPSGVTNVDSEATLRQVRYFVKSWMNEDPSLRYLMLQSAPLPVATRLNASAVIVTGIA